MKSKMIFHIFSAAISLLLLLTIITPMASQARPQFFYAQVWGQKSGSYYGAKAYISTPDPDLSREPYDHYWAAALTAVRSEPERVFIEAGARKLKVGGRHPYASWQSQDGVPGFAERTDIHLGGGLNYWYQVTYEGAGAWAAYMTSGSGTYRIARPALNRTIPLPEVVSGGESRSTTTPIGQITTQNNQWRISTNQWNSWCYTGITNNVDGFISTCNNYGWTVRFPR